MGVDYKAEFGIGYEIYYPYTGNDEDEDGYFDIDSFLEDICDKYYDKLELTYFESGEETYTGDPNVYYLCVDNPFKEGCNLTKIKNKLDKIIKDEGIETVGEFGLVGGLWVH